MHISLLRPKNTHQTNIQVPIKQGWNRSFLLPTSKRL